MNTLADYCLCWDQAGPQPYGAFSRKSIARFIAMLQQNTVGGVILYRGTARHGDKNVGDIIDYTSYPTSWSSDLETSRQFIQGLDVATGTFPRILLLDCTKLVIHGVYNKWAMNEEQEYVLPPCKLVITNKYKILKDGNMICQVEILI